MIKVKSHFDSRNTESYHGLGGYQYPLPEVARALGFITWFTVTTLRLADNEVNRFTNEDPLVDAIRNPFAEMQLGNRLITETDVNARIFLAYTTDSVTVVRADGRFSDTGLVLASEGISFNPQMVLASLAELRTMSGSVGSHELANRAYSDVLGVKHPASRIPSESVVDLFTQGSDEHGNKLSKRAKTIARPFRFWTHRMHFTGLIVPESVLNDGWAIINEDVIEETVDSLDLGSFKPIQRAEIIRWLDSQWVFNARMMGKLIDVDTGDPIQGHLKVQMAKDKLPKGVDFVVPQNGIKKELNGANCSWAVFGGEPQGIKDAHEDQQTVSNQRFLIAIPEVRTRIKDEGRKAYDRLVSGDLMKNLGDVSGDEFDRKFSSDGDSFNRMLRWNASAVVAYSGPEEARGRSLSIFDSPWLMEMLSDQWPKSLHWTPALNKPTSSFTGLDESLVETWEHTLKILVPCGKRAQVISESAARMHSKMKKMRVARGTLRAASFHKGRTTMHLMVANDYDWEHVIVPSCGGCDADDFFVVRWVTIADRKKIVITRNPNVRGEYVVLDYVEGDWFPTHKLANGKEVTFPAITKKRWPTQILEALASGELSYTQLPTKTDSEATLADDREAVNQEVAEMVEAIKVSGKPVDRLIGSRLGDKRIPLTDDAFISNAKRAMLDEIKSYRAKSKKYILGLRIPEYLTSLGNNEFSDEARDTLVDSRWEMYQASQRGEVMFEAQDAILTAWVMSKSEGYDRAAAVMALWLKCRTVPTKSTGKLSDQPVFGGGVFSHVDAEGNHHWPFLDAMRFFGVDREPLASERGPNPVEYMGNRMWEVTCPVCKTAYDGVQFPGLLSYYTNNGVCRNCR